MLPTTRDNPLSGRFNGVVQSDDGPITVKDGFAIIDGALFMVSDDGVVVTDKSGKVVAVISNGRVKELTPEIINQLRSKGYIQ